MIVEHAIAKHEIDILDFWDKQTLISSRRENENANDFKQSERMQQESRRDMGGRWTRKLGRSI